jgi:hypothetical protein
MGDAEVEDQTPAPGLLAINLKIKAASMVSPD